MNIKPKLSPRPRKSSQSYNRLEKDYGHRQRRKNRPIMWCKEAVHIRKDGHRAMNQDEGSYQLSHAYDRLLDEDLVMRSKRQNKVLKFWL